MSSRDKMESFLRRLYDQRVRGDLDGIGKCFSSNACFELAGARDASPLPTRVQGEAPFTELMRGLIDTFQLSDFTIVEMLIDGNKAAVRWRATIHHTGTKQTVTTELADFIEIADGKVVSFVEYLDTALATKVMAAKA